MRHFSTTPVPPNKLGLMYVPYPAIAQCGDDLWLLLQPFSYTKDDGTVWTAPDGMSTDLASIPRFAWNIMPPFGRYTGAAVLHDFLYQTQPCTREEADLLLAEMMDCAGVPHTERMAIYEAVKVGAQAAWDKHTAELGK